MDFTTQMWFLLVSLIVGVSCNEYYVTIKDDGPVVVGANITFVANVFRQGGEQARGTFKYKWKDNVNPQHHAEFTTHDGQSTWIVSYPPDNFQSGWYQVEVDVFSTFIIDWSECSSRASFKLTSFLNGDLILKQNSTSSSPEYVSNASEVEHQVVFHQPDAQYIANTSISTYWYLDCVYLGRTNDTTLAYNYTTSDVTHLIDAFVISSHDSNRNITQYTESSTEVYLINSTKTNDVNSNTTKFSYFTINKGVVDNSTAPPIDYDCNNKSFAPIDKRLTYGLFTRKVKVKAPISNLKIEGNNWLQHGDLLNLQVSCNGSSPFSYCVQFYTGNYSINGSESCASRKTYLSSCYFQIPRYFGTSSNYTVVIIVENDVQKVVKGVNVNVYEVTKHAQLSVIIVPVAAGIVAVILITFGIAFYVQSRHRYIVEVADFDFSNASDMEYKTFRERLIEAVSNAFNKTEEFSEEDSTHEAPANKKYGSMQ